MKRLFEINAVLIATIICMSLSFSVYAGERDKKAITLQYFINQSRANYPNFKKNKLENEIALSKLNAAEAVKDAIAKIALNKTSLKPIPENNVNVTDYDSSSAEVSFGKKSLKSGADINIGAGLLSTDKEFSNGIEKNYLNPYVHLQFNQPLLENWLGLLYRLPIEREKLKTTIVSETAKELDEFLISQLLKIFYDWVLFEKELAIYKKSYNNYLVLLEQARRKNKSGLMDIDDLYRVEAESLRYKKAIIVMEAKFKNQTNEIKKYMVGEYEGIKIYPEYDGEKDNFYASLRAGTAESTRKFKILKTAESATKKDILAERERGKPELNLSVSSKLLGYSSSKSLNGNLDYNDLRISLLFARPFGNKAHKADIKKLSAEGKKIKEDAEEFILDYKYGLRNIKNQIAMHESLIGENKKIIDITEKQLIVENKKFSRGRIDVFLLIETKNKLLNVNLELMQNKTNLLKFYSDYSDLTDQLYGLVNH
ncbi:MAG: TolC family protein [Elusimicrobiota bacterium]|nr:TolC family protein [Elusimicrobiota bacterium]